MKYPTDIPDWVNKLQIQEGNNGEKRREWRAEKGRDVGEGLRPVGASGINGREEGRAISLVGRVSVKGVRGDYEGWIISLVRKVVRG